MNKNKFNTKKILLLFCVVSFVLATIVSLGFYSLSSYKIINIFYIPLVFVVLPWIFFIFFYLLKVQFIGKLQKWFHLDSTTSKSLTMILWLSSSLYPLFSALFLFSSSFITDFNFGWSSTFSKVQDSILSIYQALLYPLEILLNKQIVTSELIIDSQYSPVDNIFINDKRNPELDTQWVIINSFILFFYGTLPRWLMAALSLFSRNPKKTQNNQEPTSTFKHVSNEFETINISQLHDFKIINLSHHSDEALKSSFSINFNEKLNNTKLCFLVDAFESPDKGFVQKTNQFISSETKKIALFLINSPINTKPKKQHYDIWQSKNFHSNIKLVTIDD